MSCEEGYQHDRGRSAVDTKVSTKSGCEKVDIREQKIPFLRPTSKIWLIRSFVDERRRKCRLLGDLMGDVKSLVSSLFELSGLISLTFNPSHNLETSGVCMKANYWIGREYSMLPRPIGKKSIMTLRRRREVICSRGVSS